jgi:hypothetical protein
MTSAKLLLPAIFGDGAVLQHSKAMVFGFGEAGENVTVAIAPAAGGQVAVFAAVADATTGRWSVQVYPPLQHPRGEVSIKVSGSQSGDDSVTANHVTFGEVFLCGGQSNMVESVSAASSGGIGASDPELQNKTWPTIRMFSVISTLAIPPYTVNDSVPHRDFRPYINRSATRCGWGYVSGQDNYVNPPQTVCQSWQVAQPGVTDDFSAECTSPTPCGVFVG